MEAVALALFARAAARIRPLLNRAVFYGIDTCRGEFNSRERVRHPGLPSRRLHALATAPLQRIAPELTALGCARIGRPGSRERWELGDGLTLEVESAIEAYGDQQDAELLEYASLLTRTVPLSGAEAIRVSALPAQFALMWRAHRLSGTEFSASPWAEDLIELVARREGISADAAALPPELRRTVARSAAEVVASESALWTIERALPDARTAHGCAARVLDRFRQLAALAA
jgi:hypothetical protein